MAQVNITATLSRDGRFWLVHVPEIDKYTQGRSVKEAREMAVDLAALWLDIPIESVNLGEVRFELPQETTQDLEEAECLAEQARAAQQKSAEARRRAAARLASYGLTVRDIGSVLGISFQRAQQLTADAPTERTSRTHTVTKKAKTGQLVGRRKQKVGST